MFTRPAKSVLEEIDQYIPVKSRDKIIETRAANIIGAAINVLELMRETYTDEDYEDLTKKFLLAIKTKESKKFTNKLRMITEGKK